MIRLHGVLIAICLSIAFACSVGNAAPKDGHALEIKFCDLVRQPQDYDERLVEVRATVKAAMHYSIVLTDAGCDDRTVVLLVPQKLSSDEQVSRLRSAVFAGYPQPARTQTTAVVRGVFRRTQGAVPTRTLTASKITDVETTTTTR